MCGMVPLMVASLALTAVSTGYTMQQQREQGKYQKGVADYNARVSENEAQETINAGTERENIHRRKTAELLSKQRAQLGAANVDLSSGSALQLQQDTVTLGEADALRIRSNFDKRSDALNTRATLTRSDGEFAESAGKSAAVGTLLSGASKMIDTGVSAKWFTPDSAANTVAATTSTGLSNWGGAASYVGQPLY